MSGLVILQYLCHPVVLRPLVYAIETGTVLCLLFIIKALSKSNITCLHDRVFMKDLNIKFKFKHNFSFYTI